MIKAMYSGTSGMKASQDALSVIANNISNSQTTAYKAQHAKFQDLFYQEMRAASKGTGKYAGSNPMDVGSGVKLGAVDTDYTQGNVSSTGVKTDLAIQGSGFFVLGDTKGQNRVYTRMGNFTLSDDKKLVSQSGQYVLGWSTDSVTGMINTGANITPMQIPLNDISKAKESTQMTVKGNLDISAKVGSLYGIQVPSWDRLGIRHDVDLSFVKMSGNTYRYLAVPSDQFKPSGSIQNAVLRPSQGIANSLVKGDYTISTAAAGAGSVTVTVKNPSGATVLTKTLADADQTVTLDDGTNPWFTIDFKGGAAQPTASTFTVAEAGNVTFDPMGNVSALTGSGGGGNAMVTYTPVETGVAVNINMDLKGITAVSADNNIIMTNTDGSPAASLIDYSISEGGLINGYYNDGSIKPIGKVAMATFANEGGLNKVGDGNYTPSPNSGLPDVGESGTGSRGQIKAQSLESSNVDISREFVDMMSVEKMYQANTKVIKTGSDVLDAVINLIR